MIVWIWITLCLVICLPFFALTIIADWIDKRLYKKGN